MAYKLSETATTAIMAEDIKLLMTLDLQAFAEGGEGGDDQGDQQGAGDDQQQQQQQDDQQGQGDQQQQQEEKPESTFTQKDVNSLVAREAKKAQEKLLKQLGVTDFNTARDGLQKFKEWQDSQKSEQEKLQEELSTTKQTLEQIEAERNDAKDKLSAISLGVDPQKVTDVIVLARTMVNEKTTIDDAIPKVLEKYPIFKVGGNEGQDEQQQQQQQPKPKFSTGEHGRGKQETELDKWLSAFNS